MKKQKYMYEVDILKTNIWKYKVKYKENSYIYNYKTLNTWFYICFGKFLHSVQS